MIEYSFIFIRRLAESESNLIETLYVRLLIRMYIYYTMLINTFRHSKALTYRFNEPFLPRSCVHSRLCKPSLIFRILYDLYYLINKTKLQDM